MENYQDGWGWSTYPGRKGEGTGTAHPLKGPRGSSLSIVRLLRFSKALYSDVCWEDKRK